VTVINIIYTEKRPQLTLFLLSAIAFKRQGMLKLKGVAEVAFATLAV